MDGGKESLRLGLKYTGAEITDAINTKPLMINIMPTTTRDTPITRLTFNLAPHFPN